MFTLEGHPARKQRGLTRGLTLTQGSYPATGAGGDTQLGRRPLLDSAA